MRGHVPTPEQVADHVVESLFADAPPETGDSVLYPGIGTAPFAAAVERYCSRHGHPIPDGVGVESDPELVAEARANAGSHVDVIEQDFLGDGPELDTFEYVVGNPPYVPIERLGEEEKRRYRSEFETAVGRFDLYLLFFERALDLLADGGRLSFLTPEKFEYVGTAEPLRDRLASLRVVEIDHLAEDTFDDLVTYPAVTTVENTTPDETTVRRRDGTTERVELPTGGASWASAVRGGGAELEDTGVTLGDVTRRISPGLATGADSVYVVEDGELPSSLREWAHPTVSGRELAANDGPDSDSRIVCPYDESGRLVGEAELGELRDWLGLHEERLRDRSCVDGASAWYRWHETPPMAEVLDPKVLCPDIVEQPKFWLEPDGDVIPRHSVYYIRPKDHLDLRTLHDYLSTPEVSQWLTQHAQKAHNDYYRMQSKVLRRLPVPEDWAKSVQQTLG